ncbi:sigma-54-dependent Fis family transcriptional regulator [Paenisporosarcina antarctica]|uniref:Sigma-54-dependent Fis family transcriptional regulator n=1 Tax=Paenisporosarcina antarctica TaxID=417367 RepID=A0A4P6ZWL6_9BACL|nr:sigma 54-interacting transcriptional regulator [Paenisporosarcina antarctica]QBP39876.1 sigma-54-dependent Fis family transcriptional regulator [Paenisporosarcina antarctica]
MKSPFLSLDFNSSPKVEKKRISNLWEHFVSGKELNLKVRTLTHQSWERSLKYGILPTKDKAPLILTEDKIQEYKSTNSHYSIIKPLISELKEVAIDSGHLVVFCNNTGEIVDLDGDTLLKRKAEKMNFMIGTSWLEPQMGTNAIGTALATGSPMQVFASEHFCQSVHNWVCSASPIRDPATNRILGVINLTGDWNGIHPHSLSTAMLIAQSIEGKLLSLLEFERYMLVEHYFETSIRNPNRVMAVLDRGGQVLKADHLFYKNGWIDSNSNYITDLENVYLIDKHRWESKNKNSKGWYFELTPYYYKDKLLGSVVHAISPGGSAKIPENNTRYSFLNLIGQSKEFKSVISEAWSIASLNLPVLIEGESGTGKELFAQSIHTASHYSSGPFIALNCGAIQKDLAESELFGYEEGTFTGGKKGGRLGKFQQAEGGTIFLDEIGELPLSLQTMLLRVLEEGEIVRLGGKNPVKLKVRVIAATNLDMKKASEEGKFRLDLYYRLNILSLIVPPLRKRSGDIPLILEYLLKKVCVEIGRSHLSVDDRALEIIEKHEWRGNVRELRNFTYKMAVKVKGDIITCMDLPKEMIEINTREENVDNSSRLYNKEAQPLIPFKASLESRETLNKMASLKDLEVQTILTVLNELDGNVSETAKRLGIHRSTIYRKLKL